MDLSPGDPLCAEAANRIEALEKQVFEVPVPHVPQALCYDTHTTVTERQLRKDVRRLKDEADMMRRRSEKWFKKYYEQRDRARKLADTLSRRAAKLKAAKQSAGMYEGTYKENVVKLDAAEKEVQRLKGVVRLSHYHGHKLAHPDCVLCYPEEAA